MPAQDDASNRLHKVERSIENGKIVAIQNHFGRNRISLVQLGKHAIFAAHVMSRFNLAAEWRPAQHKFTTAPGHTIGQIRMTGGELLDRKRAGTVEMPAEVRAEPGQIKFFPGSYGNRIITRGNHGSELFVVVFPKCETFYRYVSKRSSSR